MGSNIKVFTGATKALSVDQFFDYMSDIQGGANDAATLFGKVSWLFRAVNLRSDAMGRMPYSVWQGDEEYEWPIHLAKVLRVVESDLCLSGAGYVLKRESSVELKDLQRLNPWTMTVLTKPEAGLTEEVSGLYGFKQKVKAGTGPSRTSTPSSGGSAIPVM